MHKCNCNAVKIPTIVSSKRELNEYIHSKILGKKLLSNAEMSNLAQEVWLTLPSCRVFAAGFFIEDGKFVNAIPNYTSNTNSHIIIDFINSMKHRVVYLQSCGMKHWCIDFLCPNQYTSKAFEGEFLGVHEDMNIALLLATANFVGKPVHLTC